MEVVTPTQYFEQHSKHCPLLQAFNGLQLPPTSRKFLWRLVLFILLIYFLCNFYQIYDWMKDGKVQDAFADQSQPSDGGVGGHSNTNGGGHSNNEMSGGGGSRDPPQASSSRAGGSSSSGDNGGDDPNKKRPTRDKAEELMEVESKEEETSEDDEPQSSSKDELVTNQLQLPPGGQPQVIDANRHMHQGSSVVATVCSNPGMSSSSSLHASLKSFDQSEQLRMCPLDETTVIHEATNDETERQPQQQLPQSATSIGEEQLNLELSSAPATEGILDQLPFYTTIDIESFSGPHSPPHLSQEVSTESIQAFHANTYYDLAHLDVVKEQVLQAAETAEPFDYTLAFVFDYQGNQLLVPCLPDAEFDPAEDVHVVAVPADHVVPNFTVRINPQFYRIQ